TGTTNVADGNFHHVALERDVVNNLMRIYVDGSIEKSATLTATGVLKNDDGEADPVTIGAIIQNNTPGVGCGCPLDFFSGTIDEVAYYSRSLTPGEMKELVNEGNGVHTNLKTITPVSALPTITDPVIIDGYTQPTATANTLAVGNNA